MDAKKYESNIKKIFVIMFLNSLIFAYVIERMFALERGITVLQMQYIGIIYAVITLVLEVPCGVLADNWKRKYVWALGIGFCFFEFFISIFAYDFKTFVLAFVGAAIGGSLKSGTWDSILYESLSKLNRQEEYEKLRGQLKLLKYVAHGTVGIAGGYIGHKYGLVTNYWLSLLGTPLSIIICLRIYEPMKHRVNIKNNSRNSNNRNKIYNNYFNVPQILSHIRESLKVIKENRHLINIILYGGVTGAVLYGQLHEMSSLIYPEIGIPIYMFGFVSFAITLFGGASSVLAPKLKGKYNYDTVFAGILIVSTIAVYMFGNARHGWEVVYLIMAIAIMEMAQPLTVGYLHNNITDEYRSTISSVNSFVLNGLTIIVGMIFGYFADRLTIHAGFSAMAGILLIYSVVFVVGVIRKRSGLKVERLQGKEIL
ncbi:MFS transporter [Alkaliphilus hydrothermalis]|uniref:MFS family permease n=1 Tax=Alkaliphilus hydrothermalis TaxID=1482730 RepID=A0ABS2NPV4_9FIRM|nr:MFS transporter [Alkaliphilus hydrothermalis]MBM7614951.1 MFS family permease [Alkaliphilus hydrothermalis]